MRELDFLDGFTSPTAPSEGSTSQTLANAQAATNITGLLLDNTLFRGYVVEMDISRKTASSERRAMKRLVFLWDTTAAAWTVCDTEDNTGTDSGVTISMSSQQVQYATDSQAGSSYAGTGKWKIVRRYAV